MAKSKGSAIDALVYDNLAKGLRLLKSGDKAIVKQNALKLTIKKSASYAYYYCEKCGKAIPENRLYGRSNRGKTFCLTCCEDFTPCQK